MEAKRYEEVSQVAMMHITEDTPPDMLAGAMDLAISLPDGRDVKMAVERSTPMMDLLVQVTTAYKLRPSDHIIQAMDMSGGPNSDRALPYKPNTPIGALDTQNIRVLPKGRSLPVPKNVTPGHQPFESTFRLQVHLPRNQFHVIRVGKHRMLEDIMKKVCEEKNLDPRKYEFRHPANIDKVLDPKRTLSDYEITEITVVARGSGRLPQTLSSTDIMTLQREEDRRKMQSKTGGGVLNLIFRRGRNSMGSGSISSDTRSISPTQSDDSRSVTPPAVQPPQMLPAVPQEQTQSKPKPPQRKRRPAPKPPQKTTTETKEVTQEINQQSENTKLENGLTICHSRNSSDSSGYHEASILSDNCNTTLPRRPKSTVINSSSGDSALGMDKAGDFSKSTGNLTNMVSQSKSTTSLTTAGRKKKAPPPPPVLKAASSVANISVTTAANTPALEPNTSVVASDKPVVEPKLAASAIVSENVPKPHPRNKNPIPVPVPRRVVPVVVGAIVKNTPEGDSNNIIANHSNTNLSSSPHPETKFDTAGRRRGFQIGKSLFSIVNDPLNNELSDSDRRNSGNSSASSKSGCISKFSEHDLEIENLSIFDQKGKSGKKHRKYSKNVHATDVMAEIHDLNQNKVYEEIFSKSSTSTESSGLPSVNSLTSLRSVDSIPTFLGTGNIKKWDNMQNLDGIPVDSSMLNAKWASGEYDADSSTCQSPSFKSGRDSTSSTQSSNILTNITESTEIEKNISQAPSVNNNETSHLPDNSSKFHSKDISLSYGITTENVIPVTQIESKEHSSADITKIEKRLDPLLIEKEVTSELKSEDISELEAEWQYQLPSPPKAFRDSSPTNFTDMTNYDTVTLTGLPTDSVITPPPPPIFDKDYCTDNSANSDITNEKDINDDKVLTSKYLSLENLEKRKSLVLERELASLKVNDGEISKKANTESMLRNQKNNLINEVEEAIQNKNKALSRTNSQSKEKILQRVTDSTLPNFKITTYDQPKAKINIFEDDTIRSNVDKKYPDLQKQNSITDNVSYKTKSSEIEENFVINKRNSLSNLTSENLNFLTRVDSTNDEVFKKPYSMSKSNKFNSLARKNSQNGESVLRSESFSQKQDWMKSNPVKRSKSQISLEKYKDEKNSVSIDEDSIQKSNSMWNVSGLQSLEVMRMILPKLSNSPPASPPVDKVEEQVKKSAPKQEVPNIPRQKTAEPEAKPAVKEAPKLYQYQGPPSINLGTWSERPKSHISLKEDTDYKINNIGIAKSKFSSQTNLSTNVTKSIQQENVANVRVNGIQSRDESDSGKINIKVNSEINKTVNHETSGNVIIKIANTNSEDISSKTETKDFYSRFLNQTTATGYRKPLRNINGLDKPRPRSIAFDSSCPDISRVPIVRSVELKKPYKEVQNKSITHINHSDESKYSGALPNGDGLQSFDLADVKPDAKSSTLGNNRFSSVYVSSENINSIKSQNFYSKPVSRVNSFAFTRPTNSVPVVKGFRIPQKTDAVIDNNNKSNWNHNHYGTLPAKPSATHNSTPFSQHNLKRTNHLNQSDKFNHITNSTPIEKVILRSTPNRNAMENRNSTGSLSNTVGLPNDNMPSIPQPPVPPQLPKITSVMKKAPKQNDIDPRSQLLSAIKEFGGKAGLKPVK